MVQPVKDIHTSSHDEGTTHNRLTSHYRYDTHRHTEHPTTNIRSISHVSTSHKQELDTAERQTGCGNVSNKLEEREIVLKRIRELIRINRPEIGKYCNS